jgi:Fe-S-cluster formation regulator IscX/YfhJ
MTKEDEETIQKELSENQPDNDPNIGKMLDLEKKFENLSEIVFGIYTKHDRIVNNMIECLGHNNTTNNSASNNINIE